MSDSVNVFDTSGVKVPDRAPNARLRRNARLEMPRPRVLQRRARLAGAIAFGLRMKIARSGPDRPPAGIRAGESRLLAYFRCVSNSEQSWKLRLRYIRVIEQAVGEEPSHQLTQKVGCTDSASWLGDVSTDLDPTGEPDDDQTPSCEREMRRIARREVFHCGAGPISSSIGLYGPAHAPRMQILSDHPNALWA